MIRLTARYAAAFGLAFAIAGLGCGSRIAYAPPPALAGEQPLDLHASFDDSWNAVIQTFFERNIPVRTLEKASGLVESDELRGEIGRDCDCGTWLGVPIGGYGAYGGNAYYRFRVLVKRVADRETSLLLRSTCRGQTDRIEGDLLCHLSAAKEDEVRKAVADGVAAAARRVESPPRSP